ncbi:MAG: CocE/NonD family hydrolase [Chloroflexi bacterium]|nr:CocE/NonD family hydrolase [Chloroflexota bacterium]
MSKNWHQLISQPNYEIALDEDVRVPMRDGFRLCVDVYRPKAEGRFPALLSASGFGKDQQKLPTNPGWQNTDDIRGTGGHECGEQWYFVRRGYVQVILDPRGVGKSISDTQQPYGQDEYDLIEWIAQQPWCDGNVGMLGMSSFAGAQYGIAAKQPPHLRAIFPFEAATDPYRHNIYHGGVFNYLFQLNIRNTRQPRWHRTRQSVSLKEFTEQKLQEKVRELQNNPDIRCTPYLYIPTLCHDMNPELFDVMLHPHDGPFYQRMSSYSKFKDIRVPAYLGSRWNGWALHLPGAFDAYEGLATPKEYRKLLIIPSDNYGGMDRPFHEIQDVILRWYDHWLKGLDTGIMDEPPILLFIQGTNQWRFENEWPLKVTQWTKFYLREGGLLSTSQPGINEAPQTFTSNPWAVPTQGFSRANTVAKADPVPKVTYETEPLNRDLEITGPIAFYWHASIESKSIQARSWRGTADQGLEVIEPLTNDTDWYLKIKDIGVDGAERCVAEGWLKASHYELDESRSKPYAPYHPHSRSLPIRPGEVILYASDIRMTSNVFLKGHRIRLEIAGQDQVQAFMYHLPHMAEVKHVIYSTRGQPSYLLLPVIPKGYGGAGEPAYRPAGPFRIPEH